jgi:hypothetical protein
MDYSDTDAGLVSNLIDPKVWNYGKAGYDRTHIFRLYWNYNAPKLSRSLGNYRILRAALDDWQISGKLALQSGAPQGVTTSYSPAQDITGSTDGGRPLIIADPILPRDQRSILQAFNTAAIATPPYAACKAANPPALCWGNAPKDVYRGPGINSWDGSLFKNFHLSERLRGQFRVEAYNVLNHTNFSAADDAAKFDASGKQTNLTFGQYTAARYPRRIQLALRLSF